MIDLRSWQCQDQGCKSRAIGVGSPIGLRAVGWKVEMQANGVFPETIACPMHFQVVGPAHERLEAAKSYATFLQTLLQTSPSPRLKLVPGS